MKLSLQLKAIILGGFSALAAAGVVSAGGAMSQPMPVSSSAKGDGLANPAAGTLDQKGHALFLMNCAHCHGTDARGDEGPDLHGTTKSDARIASLIKNGKKGEMPKFGTKLADADVDALIAFVRSLKDD
jgi:mono/diheme cytochrome c family protein